MTYLFDWTFQHKVIFNVYLRLKAAFFSWCAKLS